MKRFTVTMMVVLILLISLVACGSNDEDTSNGAANKDGKTTVTMGFWGTAEDLKLYQQAAKDISEEYPNVELKLKQYPSSEQFWNTLPGEIAAGVAPDFIKISNEGAFEYIDKGLFTTLDDVIDEAGVDMDRFTPAAVDVWTMDGKTYGVPNTSIPAMFFVNVDMWEEAGLGDYPKTWEEVEAAAKKIATDNVYGIGINLHPYHITNIVKAYGGSWANGEAINSEENVEALSHVLNMYEEGVAVTPKSLGYGWDGEVFANEKAAMTTGGYWYKGYLKDANPDLNYVALPIPEGTTTGSTMISDAYVVLKDTENKKEALQAAYYLTNDKTQTEFMKLGFSPAIPDLQEKYFEANPEFEAVRPALEYSSDFDYPVETKKFTDRLVQELESSILGGADKSAKEILDSVQKDFQ